MDSESHEALVRMVGEAPNAGWVDEFFELLDDLLSEVNPRDEDPRLVTSIVRGDRIAVTMNSRYVLVAYLDDSQVGFIVRDGGERTDELVESADAYSGFDALQGEHADETPHFVTFEGDPGSVIEGQIRRHWLRAATVEFDRWQGSPYRRHHEPLVVRAATDGEYRETVLEEAFG